MPLSKEQIESLVDLVAKASTDELDCDACLDQIAEYADVHLKGQKKGEALQNVENHLANCKCCRLEFETLLTGLQAMDED